jgi:hypothetical protein
VDFRSTGYSLTPRENDKDATPAFRACLSDVVNPTGKAWLFEQEYLSVVIKNSELFMLLINRISGIRWAIALKPDEYTNGFRKAYLMC